MRVAECRVREKEALLRARPFGEFFRAEFQQELPRAICGRRAVVVNRALGGGKRRGDRVAFGLRVAVDNDVGEKSEEFRRAVLAGLEIEERGRRVDERRCRFPAAERLVVDDIFEERDVCFDAPDPELAERPAHPLERHRERLAARRDLHQQRVVERRDRAAGRAHAGVQADPESRRAPVGDDLAVVWRELVGRVLGRHPALDGEAETRNVRLRGQRELRPVQRGPAGDEDLRAHEVDAGDLLGDRVLDLDARVHLDEEPFLAVEVVEEFDRAGVVVADPLGDPDSSIAEFAADIFLEPDRGSDLDDLLVPALDRAIPLVQMQDVPVVVAEDLDLDVLRPRNVFFEKDRGIAERAARLAARLVQQRSQLGFLQDDTHPAPPATERGFDDQREPDGLGNFECGGAVDNRILRAWEGRHIQLLSERPGGGFVAHHVEKLRLGADECDPRLLARAGKFRVLRKEPVARMDHVHMVFLREPHDAVDVEIRPDRSLALADHVGLVRFEPVHREPVFLRVDRHRAHAELGRRPEHPDRDLAPVGYKDLLSDNGRRCRNALGGFHRSSISAFHNPRPRTWQPPSPARPGQTHKIPAEPR